MGSDPSCLVGTSFVVLRAKEERRENDSLSGIIMLQQSIKHII